MKTILTIGLMLLLASGAHAAATLQVDVTEFTSETALATNRSVKLTCLSTLSGTSFVLPGPKSAATDSTGSAWFSNVVAGTYQLSIGGSNPPPVVRLLLSNESGTVNAGSIVTSAAISGGASAWAATVSDLRYISGVLSNGYPITNGNRVYWVVTNATAGTGSGDVTFAQQAATSNHITTNLSALGYTIGANGSNFVMGVSNTLATGQLYGTTEGLYHHGDDVNFAWNSGGWEFDGVMRGNGSGITNATARGLYDQTEGGWLNYSNAQHLWWLSPSLFTPGGVEARQFSISNTGITTNDGAGYVLRMFGESGELLVGNNTITAVDAVFTGNGSGVTNLLSTAITGLIPPTNLAPTNGVADGYVLTLSGGTNKWTLDADSGGSTQLVSLAVGTLVVTNPIVGDGLLLTNVTPLGWTNSTTSTWTFNSVGIGTNMAAAGTTPFIIRKSANNPMILDVVNNAYNAILFKAGATTYGVVGYNYSKGFLLNSTAGTTAGSQVNICGNNQEEGHLLVGANGSVGIGMAGSTVNSGAKLHIRSNNTNSPVVVRVDDSSLGTCLSISSNGTLSVFSSALLTNGFIQPSNSTWYAVTSAMPVNSMSRAWSNGSTLEFTIHRKGDGSFSFTNSFTHAE